LKETVNCQPKAAMFAIALGENETLAIVEREQKYVDACHDGTE
jgi:hypothetical protein